jgi:CRP/FNR family transcriptional regulator, cyclic AMP receptor protein
MRDWPGREKPLEPGEILWNQDDGSGYGVYLLEGVLGVEKVALSGDRVVFTEVRKGAVLGEMSCLDGRPHSATVKALTNCLVRLFSATEFHDYLAARPEEMKRLLIEQNQRLRSLTEKFLRVGTQSVHQRLAYWLCQHPGDLIEITHHELAAQLATTRESVSKALGQLRRAGLVRSGRGVVEVLDPVALAELLRR